MNPDPAEARAQASPLERLLTVLAAVLALWVLVTTANIVRVAWVPVPIGDDWDRWLTYVGAPHILGWLFQQHIDHRLVFPKLLFEIDHFVFHAQARFTLLCTFLLQALTAVLLWRLSGRICRQDRTERGILAAVIVACLFSAQQWHNFIWPFQVQFPLLYCAVTLALFSLWKAARNNWQGGAPWVVASTVAAAIATYSMANGVLLWPVLLLAALWLRMPRRWLATLAVAALLLGPPYFYHWRKSIPPVPLPKAQLLPRAVVLFFANLGAPLTPLAMMFHTDNARLAAAAIPGILLALALLAGFVMLWRRREQFSNARALLIFYCVYLAGSSASMAYGRADASLFEAFTPRYLTPTYIFWVCMVLAAWPWLRQFPRAALYAALCAAMFVGIVIHQHEVLINVESWRLAIPLGEVALVDNVTDTTAWTPLYHTPRIVMDAVDYMRNHHLSIFIAEWTHWPGIPLNRRFFIDRNPDACQGRFEEAVMVASPVKPGWRATGWAWDVKAGRPPHYVILADDAGQVAGVALTGFPQPSNLAALPERYLSSPWNGYVDGRPRTITAYVLEADERSLCAIGTQTLPRASREAAFTELGLPLPEATPEITGDWSKDAYYKGLNGPGAPPTQGLVFGSFPDANLGTFKLGPFHLDGHTEIAIPLVTGPDNHGLSIGIRDATSKQVLAQLDPPPIHITWWAWRPNLPLDREITIEIFAEDKGSGWGQWLALGAPHILRTNP